MLLFPPKIRYLLLAAMLVLVVAGPIHHSCTRLTNPWETREKVDITGRIASVRIGDAHANLTVEANGQTWTIELGEPWHMVRANLKPESLVVGKAISVHGFGSSKPDELVIKAERIVIDGINHNF